MSVVGSLYGRFDQVPAGSYDLIYSDPPWNYYGDPNKDAAAGKHYRLMSDEELQSLPVRSKCKRRAALLLWATGPRLDAAVDLIRAWGFHYRGVAFVWVKTTRAGSVIYGQGVRPTAVKPTTEFVLLGSTLRTGRPLPVLDEAVGQVVLAPRGAHSAKPEEVRARIDRLYGDGIRRLEMFGRGGGIPGWDRFGDELERETGFEPATSDLEGPRSTG